MDQPYTGTARGKPTQPFSRDLFSQSSATSDSPDSLPEDESSHYSPFKKADTDRQSRTAGSRVHEGTMSAPFAKQSLGGRGEEWLQEDRCYRAGSAWDGG